MNHPRGFIGILALILVTVLLIVIGPSVYKTLTYTDRPAVLDRISQATSTDSQAADWKTQTIFFEIKEVGLQFAITNDIADLIYSVENAPNGATYVRFSTRSLEELGGANCGPTHGPVGAIGIWREDIFSDGPIEPTYLIKQKNFYVTYGKIQDTCSDIKEALDLQIRQLDSLSESLKTITRLRSN